MHLRTFLHLSLPLSGSMYLLRIYCVFTTYLWWFYSAPTTHLLYIYYFRTSDPEWRVGRKEKRHLSTWYRGRRIIIL